MSFYIWIAGIALALKAWVLIGRNGLDLGDGAWFLLVACLAALNLSEVVIYLTEIRGGDQSNLLSTYYVCCVLSMCAAYFYLVDRSRKIQNIALFLMLVAGALLAFAFMFTDLLIKGHQVSSFPVKAIKGDYFNVFAWFSLCFCFLSGVTIYYNFKTSKDAKQEASHLCTIVGMSILILASFFVMGLKLLEFNSNGSAFIPMATTAFLLITARGRGHRLLKSDPRKFNPLMPESKSSRRVERVLAEMSLEGLSLPEVMSKIELSIIDYQIEKSGGNKSAAARSMKISRSTLHKKIRLE